MSLLLRISTDLQGLDNLVKAAGPAANVGIARALNRAGDSVRTKYLREVRKILGIQKHRFAKTGTATAIKNKTSTRRANAGRLEYSLAGFGKGLDLLYYQPKETPAGMSVNWLGARRVIPHTFFMGSRFPKRRGGFGPRKGVSMERTGSGRFALKARPRGPGVPEGMVAPSSAALWEAEAQAKLAPRIAHELVAILQGYASANGRGGVNATFLGRG